MYTFGSLWSVMVGIDMCQLFSITIQLLCWLMGDLFLWVYGIQQDKKITSEWSLFSLSVSIHHHTPTLCGSTNLTPFVTKSSDADYRWCLTTADYDLYHTHKLMSSSFVFQSSPRPVSKISEQWVLHTKFTTTSCHADVIAIIAESKWEQPSIPVSVLQSSSSMLWKHSSPVHPLEPFIRHQVPSCVGPLVIRNQLQSSALFV